MSRRAWKVGCFLAIFLLTAVVADSFVDDLPLAAATKDTQLSQCAEQLKQTTSDLAAERKEYSRLLIDCKDIERDKELCETVLEEQ